MIRVRLREAMQKCHDESGAPVTYEWLARKTALSRATIEAIGSRTTYNPRLSTISRLCEALRCSPAELLELSTGAPSSRTGRRT